MTPRLSVAGVLADEALRAREFPVCGERVYLAHAAVGPLPARVAGAIRGYLDSVTRNGQFEFLHAKAEAGARSLAAQMLGCTADEIAFIPSTSAGLSLVAAGLDWQAGDSVVFPAGDFPSNVHPWQNLERRGVRAKAIPRSPAGPITVDDVAGALDARTRLVALSSVHFVTGARTDVEAIGAFLQERGVRLCVDAIQSFGVLPLSARYIDFLAADAHKWLLGPQGMGILFVRRERFGELAPQLLGWKSAFDTKDFSKKELELPAAARRYEPGSLNALGLVGLHAALELLAEVGTAAIADRLAALRGRLVAGLEDKGYVLVGKPAPAHFSGITSFRHDDQATTVALQQRLDKLSIVTSLRVDPEGKTCIRVAPHFYTSDADIDRLLGELPRAA